MHEALYNTLPRDTRFTTYGNSEVVFQKQSAVSAMELNANGAPVRSWRFHNREVVTPV